MYIATIPKIDLDKNGKEDSGGAKLPEKKVSVDQFKNIFGNG